MKKEAKRGWAKVVDSLLDARERGIKRIMTGVWYVCAQIFQLTGLVGDRIWWCAFNLVRVHCRVLYRFSFVVSGDGMVGPDTQLYGGQWWYGGARYYYVYQILWIIFNDMPRVVQWLREASTLHEEWGDNWKEHFGIRCCQELVEEGSIRKEEGPWRYWKSLSP